MILDRTLKRLYEQSFRVDFSVHAVCGEQAFQNLLCLEYRLLPENMLFRTYCLQSIGFSVPTICRQQTFQNHSYQSVDFSEYRLFRVNILEQSLPEVQLSPLYEIHRKNSQALPLFYKHYGGNSNRNLSLTVHMQFNKQHDIDIIQNRHRNIQKSP